MKWQVYLQLILDPRRMILLLVRSSLQPMRSDIHSGLASGFLSSSVGEVAVFAFSLLELLLTRILPFAAFLAGQILLHFCRLLASAVGAASGHREPRGEYSRLQSEEYAGLQYTDDSQGLEDHEYEERWRDQKIEDRQDDADVQGAISAIQDADAAAELADHLLHTDLTNAKTMDSRPSDFSANGVQGAMQSTQRVAEPTDRVHVADSTPSDAQAIDSRPSDIPADIVEARYRDHHAHVSDSRASDEGSSSEVRLNDEAHVAKSGLSEGQGSGLGPSDGQRSRGSMKWRGGQMMRVLPPSLSQIKRTLMQRSRRASPSQSKSPMKPSKKHSPSSKFRKHFLLDRA